MASQTFTSASISMANAISISNTIAANSNSISSLNSSNTKSFTNNITSSVSSAIQDPVKSVLSKTLSSIATTTNQAEKKIQDLQSNLSSYLNKNSTVQVVGNKIVISVTSQNKAQGQAEQYAIQSHVNSIKNTLNTLHTTIGTLSTITSTITVLLTALTVMESLIAVNPAAKVAFTVFKQAIKVVFLRDMLTSYLSVINNQLNQSSSQLAQFTSEFMNLQVTLNISDNSNQGNSVNPDQALSNITKVGIGVTNDSQSQSYLASNGQMYILSISQQSDGQLIGKAIQMPTGQIAAQTSPSFISSSDDLINELKTIINA